MENFSNTGDEHVNDNALKLKAKKSVSAKYAELMRIVRFRGYYPKSKAEMFFIFASLVEYIVTTVFGVGLFFAESLCKNLYSPWGRFFGDGAASDYSYLIECIMKKYDCPFYEAVMFVASRVGMKVEYCFKAFDGKGKPKNSVLPIAEMIPESILNDEECYKLAIKYPIATMSGDIEGYICLYNTEDKFLVLAAVLFEHNCRQLYGIGMREPKAFLANRDLVAKNTKAQVFYFMDVVAGIHFSELLQKSEKICNNDVVAIFHYGGDDAYKFVDLSILRFREVSICAAPTREGFLQALTFSKMCLKFALSVKIYPYPIIPYASSSVGDINNELNGLWEQSMAREAIWLRDCSLPDLTQSISQKALSFDDYVAMGKATGVLEDKNDVRTPENGHEAKIEFHTIKITSASSYVEQTSCEGMPFIDTIDVIRPCLLSILWAPQNVGKSLFALHIALCIAFGIPLLFFTASKPRKVGIIDGESDEIEFNKRIFPLHGKHYIQQELMENLKVFFNKKMPQHKKVNLLCLAYQEVFIQACISEGITVLIFDNIMSLCPSAIQSTKDFQTLHQFIGKLAEHGIAVLLVHHSGKVETSLKGFSDFEALSQNVFCLEKLEKEKMQGAHCIFKVTKCKSTPELEGTPHEIFLPLGASEWKDLSVEVSTPLENDFHENGQIVSVVDLKLDLSRDEKTIMHFLGKCKTGTITRAEAEKELSCGKDKARSVLNSLRDKNCIELAGDSRNTHYRLCFK